MQTGCGMRGLDAGGRLDYWGVTDTILARIGEVEEVKLEVYYNNLKMETAKRPPIIGPTTGM